MQLKLKEITIHLMLNHKRKIQKYISYEMVFQTKNASFVHLLVNNIKKKFACIT